MKKTLSVVVIVVLFHCVLLGSVVLMQGCGKTSVIARPSQGAVMPPIEPEVTQAIIKPVHQDTIMIPDVGTEEVYTVKRGDTLSVIAKRYGVSVQSIVRLNGLKSAHKIYINQRLRIPGPAGSVTIEPAPARAPAAPEPVSTEGMDVYTVAPGDCLSKIAVRCGTTVTSLRNANKLTSDRIFVGQKLLVPAVDMDDYSEPTVDMPVPEQVEDPMPVATAPVVVDDPEPMTSSDEENFVRHIVSYDEDLDEVARKYAVSAERLREFNNLPNDTIQADMVLKIPLSE